MKLRTMGTYGTAAIGILVAAAMAGPTALAQESDEPEATEEIIVTGIRVVGHIVVEPDGDNDESLNAILAPAECERPMFYLAPRAAVILQHVFSAVVIETTPSVTPDRPQSFAMQSLSQDESTRSPVADRTFQTDSSELTDPATGSKNAETVPNFQRKMFRTDI